MYSCYMFRLQVTIIGQIFRYMDMTCSVPQYGIPYCLHLLCRISDIMMKLYTANVNNMGSHTVTMNMSCPYTEMSA